MPRVELRLVGSEVREIITQFMLYYQFVIQFIMIVSIYKWTWKLVIYKKKCSRTHYEHELIFLQDLSIF